MSEWWDNPVSLADLEAADKLEREQRHKHIVLDHELGWLLSYSERLPVINLLGRARALYSGIAAIAARVASVEAAVRSRCPEDQAVSSWGMVPGVPAEELLTL